MSALLCLKRLKKIQLMTDISLKHQKYLVVPISKPQILLLAVIAAARDRNVARVSRAAKLSSVTSSQE